MTDKVPERVYRYKFQGNWYLSEYKCKSGSTEYLLKSSVDKKLEPVKKLHEKWKDRDHISLEYHNESWQVIKELIESTEGGKG